MLIINLMNNLCPCKSKKLYSDCCEKYHLGKSYLKNASVLMRSRFSAYALGQVDYIIKTSHKKNPCFKKGIIDLKKDLENFCKTTSFIDLEILNQTEEKNQAFVTFIAYLKSNNTNCTFTEISHFQKVHGKWFYKDGQIFEGARKDLL